MGCCVSDNSQDKKTDNALSKQLQADQSNDRLTKKLLLLGPGNSGKSTFFKQLRKIHGQGYVEKEILDGQRSIYDCVLSQMKELIALVTELKYPLSPEAKASVKFIKDLPNEIEINLEIASRIEILWEDPMIKKAYENRNNLGIADSAAHFFTHIKRIGKGDYKPTDEDLLLVRTATTGVTTTQFTMQGHTFRIFDVGGQRSERSKWIHCFDSVTAVLFVAALSCYDQSLYEDANVNAMEETLILFNEVCTSRWFKSTAMILFLNKKDLFEERLKKIPLNACEHFKNYNGETVDDAIGYVKQVFIAHSGIPNKQIFTHVTTATNQDNVSTVFYNVQLIVIKESLARGGLL